MRNSKRTVGAGFYALSLLLVSLCVWLSSGESTAAQQSALSLLDGDSNLLGGLTTEKVSPDLVEKARHPQMRNERVRVILQLEGEASSALNSLLQRADVNQQRLLQNFNARVLELPAHLVEKMAARGEVRFISMDRPTLSFGHVSQTTGADAVRISTGINTSGLDGTGIGIAVLDSGIDPSHTAFRGRINELRVVVNRDFTGEGRTDDPYGHGTHVAATAAGNGRISNASYIGIAPNANIVNLRVLKSNGTGTVSAVLSALDWVMTNRTLYNIRVVNMSLGAPAIESYKNDPVCLAVRRLVDAGVVVLVAAGNNGKDSLGQKVYGQVHSPGNEPSAITVGATNTFGTDERGDDVVATFSSRGPTRSSWKDALGIRHYDNLIKPDIVAPGNKIVEAEAIDNYLVQQNPALDAGISQADGRRMMYLNGTSMATPVAAGAAALLLQANPSLTPNLIKAILMYTAQPLAGFNMFEQGAGQINIEGAVRLARL
ncbi:MAG TPA: S8 family peptidase, partial [Pyrinomonadaceae bacterium]